jgi:phosphonate transport system substrate-binding protein
MSCRRTFLAALSGLLLTLPLTACGPGDSLTETGSDAATPLTVGAIPDQDAELLQRLYSKLADYLEAELGVPVEYRPVTDYTASVTAFRLGDLDLVWFGAVTGVQARIQVEGAQAIAQRDIDAGFHSIFIANADSGIPELNGIEDLEQLKGRSFTFGSESSTSGRLMPQYFLEQGGVTLEDFRGEPGFSGNHDAILQLVEAGTYEVGVLNEQVWLDRLAAGEVDESRVQQIWRTPEYFNYHWLINPSVEERYGEGFIEQVQAALLALDADDPEQAEILALFGAEQFISTENSNYDAVEEIGREIGQIQ